ncbi:protein kinase domain-containing protein [Terrisporobacter muris]|nr:protein kinase [Terrisporobacter muris]MCR1823749.1 protein kinase [Terrisporobacter muris]
MLVKNFNNKYTIRDFIDKNKWSNVYMAINKETNEQIVINILINVEGNEENLENFKREVNLLEDINNPNVICINEISTYMNKDKVYYYIESENFEGLTLDELMRINKLNEDQCLQIIREVINGVKAFNNQKINFKNLTVENIIINGEGVVKIDTLSFINNHKGHINCEIYNPKKFDTHEDVYAIGSILCEMITGEKLFNKEEHKDLDKNIVEILEKSTNKKHISRYKYKDLSEFLDDVNLYLDGGEISEKSAINFEKIHKLNPSPKVKKYMAIGCCGVVLLCSTAFGAQYLINKNNNNMETTNTSEDIDKTEESPETNKIEAITPTEENLITPQNSSENDKEETTDNNKNDENNNNENMNDQNNNHDNNHEDNDKDNNTDKENPDKDDPDKDDNKDENEDGNKDEPEQNPDDNDDKENPDEENPDNDNSNEEKPDQNPNEDQNGDKNNENTTQDSENK